MNDPKTADNVCLFIIVSSVLFIGLMFSVYNPERVSPFVNRSPAALKIAIIDTGYQMGSTDLKLCPTGHYDFASNETKIAVSKLYPNHGTMVASIIADKLKNVDYCAVIYQVQASNPLDVRDVAKALRRAIEQHVDAINVSITGDGFSQEEYDAYTSVALHHIPVFVAAGNNHKNLALDCTIYPACYYLKSVTVVGATTESGLTRASYSNYGNNGIIDKWYPGDLTWRGIKDAGTSYASPRALSDYVLSLFVPRSVAKH